MRIKGMLEEIMELRRELTETDTITLDGNIARVRLINQIRSLENEIVQIVQTVCRDHFDGLERQVKVTQGTRLEITLNCALKRPTDRTLEGIKTALKQEGVDDRRLTIRLP